MKQNVWKNRAATVKTSFLAPLLLLFLSTLARADFTIISEFERTYGGADDGAHADVDGDGDQDIVLFWQSAPLGSGGQSTTLHLNDGTGKFTTSPQFIDPCFSGSLADLNGDGAPDLVQVSLQFSLMVRLNNGSGQFLPITLYSGGTGLKHRVFDAEGDGDLDVVSVGQSADLTLWINNGSGVFTNGSSQFGVIANPSTGAKDVETGDFDGDGDQDVIVLGNIASALYRRGATGYTEELAPLAVMSGTTNARALTSGDLDGDGDLDLWLSDGNSISPVAPCRLFLNNGSGSFTAGTQVGSDTTNFTHLLDADSDGDLDAFVCTDGGQQNRLYTNTGFGQFLAPVSDVYQSQDVADCMVADFNGDGRKDLMLVGFSGATLLHPRLPPGIGNKWGPSTIAIRPANNRPVPGDFDGDGDVDLLVGSGATFGMLRNQGDATFDPATTFFAVLAQEEIADLVPGDFDGDGDLDVFVCTRGNGTDAIYRNNGSGVFTRTNQVFDLWDGAQAIAADLEPDGDLDIIVGSGDQTGFLGSDPPLPGDNALLLNNGGVFTQSNPFGPDRLQEITAADLNNDGDLDVVASTSTEVRVWRQTAPGTFVDGGQLRGLACSSEPVVRDFDGDGDADVFLTGSPSVLYLSQNNGSFVLGNTLPIEATGAGAAVPIDVEPDGDWDLWIGRASFDMADKVFVNNGSGSFTVPFSLGPRPTYDLVRGDFDGDGAADILVASLDGAHAIYSRNINVVRAYAESFGLTQPNTGANRDPDGDGLVNWQECAFNLNPAVADYQTVLPEGSFGAPMMTVVRQPSEAVFTGTFVRRYGMNLDYAVEAGPDLEFNLTRNHSVERYQIDSNYERVVVSFGQVTTLAKYFARLKVIYTP